MAYLSSYKAVKQWMLDNYKPHVSERKRFDYRALADDAAKEFLRESWFTPPWLERLAWDVGAELDLACFIP